MKTSNTRPQETIKDVIARGFRSLSQGNLDEARGCCMAVLKQQPKNEQAHFLVGLIYGTSLLGKTESLMKSVKVNVMMSIVN